MSNKNGFAKNMERVSNELAEWRSEMRDIGRRLRKPSLNPKNREHFVPHVLTGVIEETYDKLPRTLTYLTIIALGVLLVRGAAGFF